MVKPLVSIIIPTYNEEKNLRTCLESIKNQSFSIEDIEIIIIDDGSTDHTIEIAKKYNTRILCSGFKHIERSKSLGIKASKGKYLFFIDADIRLIDRSILTKSVSVLEKNSVVLATQCIYWKYDRSHSIVNRYCELFGINDPFPFYLQRRGIRSFLDDGWIYPASVIKDTKDYYLVTFDSGSLPTLGSQGYLCRSIVIKRHSHWNPYFFHLDVTKELVDQGYSTFAMMKLSVEHDYVDSIFQFYKKLYRNILLFYKYRLYRTYDYNVKSPRFFIAVILMVSIIVPTYDSIRGFLRKPDVAWFLHPVFCFTVPLLYAFVTLKHLMTIYVHNEG